MPIGALKILSAELFFLFRKNLGISQRDYLSNVDRNKEKQDSFSKTIGKTSAKCLYLILGEQICKKQTYSLR